MSAEDIFGPEPEIEFEVRKKITCVCGETQEMDVKKYTYDDPFVVTGKSYCPYCGRLLVLPVTL